MAIVGPNGAGKSTLLKAMLNLIKPISGNVLFNGQPYEKQRRHIGYVPQRGSVDWEFPTTVLDVVLMGRYSHIGWIKRPRQVDKKYAMEALKKSGNARFCQSTNKSVKWWTATKSFLGKSTCTRRRHLFYG